MELSVAMSQRQQAMRTSHRPPRSDQWLTCRPVSGLTKGEKHSPMKDRLPMQSTVAAMILAFDYRCGGSDGLAAYWPRTVFPFHPNNGAVIGTPANVGKLYSSRFPTHRVGESVLQVK